MKVKGLWYVTRCLLVISKFWRCWLTSSLGYLRYWPLGTASYYRRPLSSSERRCVIAGRCFVIYRNYQLQSEGTYRSSVQIYRPAFEGLPLEYTGCNRRKGPDFGRVFLMLNYTEKPQNTYIQSWTVWEIMAKFETLTAVTHLLITKFVLKLAGICGFCNVNSCT